MRFRERWRRQEPPCLPMSNPSSWRCGRVRAGCAPVVDAMPSGSSRRGIRAIAFGFRPGQPHGRGPADRRTPAFESSPFRGSDRKRRRDAGSVSGAVHADLKTVAGRESRSPAHASRLDRSAERGELLGRQVAERFFPLFGTSSTPGRCLLPAVHNITLRRPSIGSKAGEMPLWTSSRLAHAYCARQENWPEENAIERMSPTQRNEPV